MSCYFDGVAFHGFLRIPRILTDELNSSNGSVPRFSKLSSKVADDPYNAAGLFASVTVAPASSYALDEELSIDEGLLVRWPGRELAELLAKDGRHRASLHFKTNPQRCRLLTDHT